MVEFYHTPHPTLSRWGEGESYKVTHEIAAINRHSEQQRKNPADYDTKQLQNNQNFSPETALASSHLNLFRVGIAMPTY